jgi:hypothetical protein
MIETEVQHSLRKCSGLCMLQVHSPPAAIPAAGAAVPRTWKVAGALRAGCSCWSQHQLTRSRTELEAGSWGTMAILMHGGGACHTRCEGPSECEAGQAFALVPPADRMRAGSSCVLHTGSSCCCTHAQPHGRRAAAIWHARHRWSHGSQSMLHGAGRQLNPQAFSTCPHRNLHTVA